MNVKNRDEVALKELKWMKESKYSELRRMAQNLSANQVLTIKPNGEGSERTAKKIYQALKKGYSVRQTVDGLVAVIKR